jgi:hypothetical protein
MTKAYFYLKDIFQNGLLNTTNEWVIKLQVYDVGGVNQLTPEYSAETTNVYGLPINDFEYSDCSFDGSSIDACELGGINDSWNPFFANMAGQWDNVVNSQNRGAFLQSDSGNLYGIESLGLGFDNLAVPINDIPSGGSSGATGNGSFFMNIDLSQDFLAVVSVQIQPSGGGPLITQQAHRFEYIASTCTFSYLIQDLLSVDPDIDATEWAFLSGGNSGWIDLGCGSFGGDLGDDPIVVQSICSVPTTPQQPQTIVSEELDECCYQSPVLASSTSNEEWQNDINAFLFKRNFSSETITLTLQKNGITDLPIVNDDYGVYYDFGAFSDYPNYKGVKIEWQKVLLLEGEGTYRIKVESNFLTGSETTYSIPFELKEYTQTRANGTFRIQSIQNGFLRNINFDFTNLNWIDGLRIRGFFGNRQAEYEQENVLYANRDSKQVRSELINKYVCQTMHIPDCITDQIIEYHNFANKLYFTDYNLNNHKKTYIQKEVVFDSMDSIEYKDVSTFAPLQLNYKDFNQNYLKINS